MQTDAPSRCADISLSSDRIADTLYRGLERCINLRSRDRQTRSLSLRRLPRTAPSQLMRFQLSGCDSSRMVVAVTVTRLAPNVYDIVCDVEDGGSHRFSCRLPAGVSPTLLRASQLGRKIAQCIQEKLAAFRDASSAADVSTPPSASP